MPEQSEGNNQTSKINVSPVLHTIFSHWRVKKCILLPRKLQKSALFDPLVEKIIVVGTGS